LIGRESIRLEKFAGLSGRVSIYSSTDDYSGEFMTNPTVPEDLTRVESAPVVLMKHVIVGASAVILPGVTVGEVSAIAALSLVSRDVPKHVIAGGTPCRVIKPRSQKVIELEKKINA
jgi:galactoside O-acetyltransferase